MSFTIEDIDGVSVITLSGDVLGGAEALAFSDAVNALTLDGTNHVVVDLGGVGLMNSSGLGMLVGATKSLRSQGGHFAICGASEQIQNLLKMTRLDTVLTHYASRDEATKMRYS